MRWKKQLLSLTPYQPGKSIEAVKQQYGLDNIVKLASNENPFGCSNQVLEEIKNVPPSAALYPDGYASNLRSSLAEMLKVAQEQLIFGNGSDELIQIISRALLHPEASTIMAAPTFPQYKHNAIIEGAKIKEVPLVNGEHDLDAMIDVIDETTNVIWICSPNNPTGKHIPEVKLLNFLENIPEEILVVLDEAYYEYAVAEDYYDAIELLNRFNNLIVLRTFSKIYGLASLRIGYGVSHPGIIRALEPAREPFNTSSFAQLAALTALKDQDFVKSCRQTNREGLEQFYQFCLEKGLDYYPSQGNFILIDFNRDGDEVFLYLMEKGFIVRSGKALGFPTSVRVTIGSREQNKGIMNVMNEFLAEKKIVTSLK
jgi:histidinol-phosphate aminotransferase